MLNNILPSMPASFIILNELTVLLELIHTLPILLEVIDLILSSLPYYNGLLPVLCLMFSDYAKNYAGMISWTYQGLRCLRIRKG